jgi:hypothetical protein
MALSGQLEAYLIVREVARTALCESQGESQGHALCGVQHAPPADPVRRLASRTHVVLGRAPGGRERKGQGWASEQRAVGAKPAAS